MRKPVLLVISVVLGSLSLLACSSEDEAATGSQTSAQSAVQRCSGRFICAGSAETRLERHGDGCYAGALRLEPGGAAVAEDLTGSWHETSNGFEVCADGECLECVSTEPAPAAAPTSKGGTCTGYASSCIGRPAGSCGTQQGCSLGSHVRWNGDLEYECEGSARSCSSFGSEESCNNQTGCHWE